MNGEARKAIIYKQLAKPAWLTYFVNLRCSKCYRESQCRTQKTRSKFAEQLSG